MNQKLQRNRLITEAIDLVHEAANVPVEREDVRGELYKAASVCLNKARSLGGPLSDKELNVVNVHSDVEHGG